MPRYSSASRASRSRLAGVEHDRHLAGLVPTGTAQESQQPEPSLQETGRPHFSVKDAQCVQQIVAVDEVLHGPWAIVTRQIEPERDWG
jgi:hypothetical protein